jgi:hypothetical protein|eukprot:COSAG01_NODE_1196_length_11303_cov_16.500714_15_plen_82_part_00
MIIDVSCASSRPSVAQETCYLTIELEADAVLHSKGTKIASLTFRFQGAEEKPHYQQWRSQLTAQYVRVRVKIMGLIIIRTD